METRKLKLLATPLIVLMYLLTGLLVVVNSTIDIDEPRGHSTFQCQLATHQGHRKYQEDRMMCAHEAMTFGAESRNISIAAVFDGHNGAEASEMAAKLFPKYFLKHVHDLGANLLPTSPSQLVNKCLTPYKTNITSQVPHSYIGCHPCGTDFDRLTLGTFPSRSMHMEVLKESLLRSIYDIDSTFSKDAFEKDLNSGSTAVIALLVDGEILVANVGDSKAILCSKSMHLPQDVKASLARLKRMNGRRMPSVKHDEKLCSKITNEPKCFLVNELSKDHHPDNVVETTRVKGFGGHIEEWAGVPRVNGILAVSRSIGDVYLKRYGVISIPDVAGWQRLSGNDTYLVVGSDGIFEKLSTQEVCNLLWDAHSGANIMTESSANKNSLADSIINVSVERGTTDNMSVIVISLESIVPSNY